MRMLWVLLAGLCFCVELYGQARKDKTLVYPNRTGDEKHAKNVILFVGGGMGLTQISAALYSAQNALNLEQFPIAGLQKAYTADRLVSDASASATALATGVKVNAGKTSASQGKHVHKTLIQEAELRGLASGIFVNSALTDNFPAAFVSQWKGTEHEPGVAESYLKSEMDLVIGGGRKYFNNIPGSDRNLLRELEQKGYQVSDYTKEVFPKITLDLKKNAAYFISEGADTSWVNNSENYLAACRLAALFLKKHSSKGFMLVIGMERTTSVVQDSLSNRLVTDIRAFDRMVGGLLDFARQDGETLLVVTADQEFGGFAINPGSQKNALLTEFTTDTPTAILLPVFAFGPHAKLFSGVYENTEIHRRIRMALGWERTE